MTDVEPDAGLGRLAVLVEHPAVPGWGDLATSLLAGTERWTVRRLAPPLSRLAVKQLLDAATEEHAAALIVIGAPTRDVGGAQVVVLADAVDHVDDATLSLAWVAARAAARCSHAMLVLAAAPAPQAAGEACRAHLPGGTVLAATTGARLVDRLALGVGGAALDPATGRVTSTSLARFVAHGPDVYCAPGPDTPLVTPGAFALLRSWRIGGVAASPAPPVAVGTVLPGRFRLDAELARGTFGTVYRARQLAVERDVAIKLLHADIAPDSQDGQLFLNEIRAVGRLDHPNVVRIYQADRAHDGRLFFAMEFLAGRTLAELAAAGPLETSRAVALMRQVLAGLGAAHDAGLIHADVKPANVIVVAARSGERAVLVDFGLARLRAAEPSASAGGTPAFMAPEQLRHGRVDARSDLFSAAMVLVHLLTGWRRRKASELVPPLDGIADPHVQAALARALALTPADRFTTAAEFAAALAGGEAPVVEAPPPPFHGLASFTERDAERLRGRDRELATLVDHALFRGVVVVTAPSGTGKTSLLRAGLVPALARYGAVAVYASARAAPLEDAIARLAPGAPDLDAAIAARLASGARRVVVVFDQLEALLDGTGPRTEALASILALAERGRPDCAVVLAVREDVLARVLTRRELAAVAVTTLRVGPLDPDGARAAVVEPLTERRVAITPAALAAVLDDLITAGTALAPEFGWGDGPAVYPPHLQLVGSVLFAGLGSDEATVTLDHYQRLGGFAAIVGEHLERVLETELSPDGAAVARELFVALVTSTHGRASRAEAELVAMAGGRGEAPLEVLEVLRRQGLVLRTQRGADEATWELMHDSLVPRVESWLSSQDRARHLAMDQVRYHLRQSRGGALSLLSRRELAALDEHPGALVELEREYGRRAGEPVTPAALVARSRGVVRRSLIASAAVAATVLGIVGYAGCDRYRASVAADRERSIRDRDLGRFTLELRPFDWIPAGVNPWLPGGAAVDVPASELPELSWTIVDPDDADPTEAGAVRSGIRAPKTARIDASTYVVETPGGAAFLVVSNRHRIGERPCPPVVVPLRNLPGAARRTAGVRLSIPVASCRTSEAGTIEIPGGRFLAGGAGTPTSWVQVRYGQYFGRPTWVDAFRIDRVEITNAAYAMFASIADITGATRPIYPSSDELVGADRSNYPVTAIGWRDARAFCRFLGKELPTAMQFQKALRGGFRLPDGSDNPAPGRNFAWGAGPLRLVNVGPTSTGPAAVGSFPDDLSPYGVLDLVGNVEEWLDERDERGMVMTLGGNWAYSTPTNLADMLAAASPRPIGLMVYFLGARCVTSAPRALH